MGEIISLVLTPERSACFINTTEIDIIARENSEIKYIHFTNINGPNNSLICYTFFIANENNENEEIPI